MDPWQAVLQPADFVYHCSDCVVSHGHLPLLNRPRILSISFATCTASIPITKHALAWRTQEVFVGSKASLATLRFHPVDRKRREE
jgi:hypothetical protein